jgi:hypothetical protein
MPCFAAAMRAILVGSRSQDLVIGNVQCMQNIIKYANAELNPSCVVCDSAKIHADPPPCGPANLLSARNIIPRLSPCQYLP